MARRNKTGFEDLLGALQRSSGCADHPPLARSSSPADAQRWWDTIQHCSTYMQRDHLRWFGRNDLFFLLVYLLHRRHFIVDERKARWTFARCNEVQDSPNGHLDLWFREAFKSEIVTFGMSMMDILRNPEVTIGIFSHTRPFAKDFLTLIKRECEFNSLLKATYPDVLWRDPKHECRNASVSWSENEGITVRRAGNPKEATVESYGLIDGQPVGKRYQILVYDDVVSRDAISPLMMQLVTEQFDNSLLMTASDPVLWRYCGTFQEFGDTSAQLIERGVGKLRLYGAFDENRESRCHSESKLQFFKQNLPPKVFALQVLLDPTQAKDPDAVGFSQDWVEYWDPKDDSLVGMNKYIVVDPAGNAVESNSYFAMWAVALGADKRIRVLDMWLDKYDLEERWQVIFEAVQKWDPLRVGYEKYGLQNDIDHFRFRMRETNNIFTIVPLGGGFKKDDRIELLIPPFRDHRILLPRGGMKKTQKSGREVDLVREFLDIELLTWPYNPGRRDLLDSLARLFDPALGVVYPRRYGASSAEYRSGSGPPGQGDPGSGSWMSS